MFRRNDASDDQPSISRQSFMDAQAEGLMMPPEIEQGNVEYKLQLVNTPPERIEHLISQLKWRLAEGYGEAMYEIGVSDKGSLVGLTQHDLDASLATLKKMGTALCADVSVIRERVVTADDTVPARKVAEVLIRRCLSDHHHFLEVRVAIIGGADAGKSTLLGVISNDEADNGRGKARLNLLRHRHEIASGRTSSISHQILGFDPHGTPINYASNNVNTWAQICEASSKIITFLDMCGHPKYQKTTLSGLTGHSPDHACLIIGANSGVLPDVSREHLRIAVSLKVPVFAVITKIDIATPQQLTRTVGALLSLLKSPGIRRVPLVVQNRDDVVVSASELAGMAVIPIFLTSSVTGENLPLLIEFFNLLPKHPTANLVSLADEPLEYQVEEVYEVPGAGSVVGGKLLAGRVVLPRAPHPSDQRVPTDGSHHQNAPQPTLPIPQQQQVFYIGPDRGVFAPVAITSIHRHRCPVNAVHAGQAASFALTFLNPNPDGNANDAATTLSTSPPAAGTSPQSPTLAPQATSFRLRKGQCILTCPAHPTWVFTAELSVLHAGTAGPLVANTHAVVYIHSVRQAVRVVRVVEEPSGASDTGGGGATPGPLIVELRFLVEPERILEGRALVMRGVAGLKCVGKVLAVPYEVPPEEDGGARLHGQGR
ncbi:P-loop containing nucleoside triphosphate hydrolase protein [Geranomyces variabilis]|nr:P-loop containing nucleoside triphosphate hydrolase protein [Geranomyces variabilis]KAJ3135151.1 GTP binding protein [Geranomyces variabilis]